LPCLESEIEKSLRKTAINSNDNTLFNQEAKTGADSKLQSVGQKHNILFGLALDEEKHESEESSEEDLMIQLPIYEGDDGRRRKKWQL